VALGPTNEDTSSEENGEGDMEVDEVEVEVSVK
jgi:hypothetical protein